MTANRREFIQTTALASSAFVAGSRLASANEKKKYKACVIACTPDTYPKNRHAYSTGYGHQLDKAFMGREETEIAAIADPNEASRERAMEITEAENGYADYQEMLEKEKPDLVAIGTNLANLHKDIAVAALEAGAHIFIEKPLCTSLADADAIVNAAKKKNLKIAVAHQMRPAPSMQHLYKLIDEGLIGELVEMRGRGKEDHRSGGEDLIVMGTHIFDLMQWFAGGKPVSCQAYVLQDGQGITAKDVREPESGVGPLAGTDISAMYLFDTGLPAFYACKKTEDGNKGRWGLDLYGTRGAASIRMNQKPHIWINTAPSWSPSADGQEEEGKWIPLPDDPMAGKKGGGNVLIANNRAIVDDLIAAIEEDRQPLVGALEARTALEMIYAAYASQIEGRRIAIPMKERRNPLTLL